MNKYQYIHWWKENRMTYILITQNYRQWSNNDTIQTAVIAICLSSSRLLTPISVDTSYKIDGQQSICRLKRSSNNAECNINMNKEHTSHINNLCRMEINMLTSNIEKYTESKNSEIARCWDGYSTHLM